MKKHGLDNADIFINCAIQEVAYRNRFGAYESLLGQKRSFSIYMPYVYDAVLKWKDEFFNDRLALKELIRKKMPELSQVGAQNYLLAPSETNRLVNKIKGIIIYLLRGAGTTTPEIYRHKHQIRQYYVDKLTRDNSWYRRVFKDLTDYDIRKLVKQNHNIAALHLKHCLLLDKLETGEYMNYKKKFSQVREIILNLQSVGDWNEQK